MSWVERTSFEALRAPLEARLSAATGREVRLGGEIHFDFALRPRFWAERATVANPPGWGSPHLLEVERLDLAFDLLELLRGRLFVKAVELRDVALHLERDAEGEVSWMLPGLRDVAADGGGGVALQLRAVSFENLAVTWRDALRGSEWIVSVDRLVARGLSGVEHLELDLAGRFEGESSRALRGQAFDLAARLAPVEEPDTMRGMSLWGSAIGIQVSADGEVAWPPRGAGVDLQLSGTSEEAATVAALFGRDLPPIGPLAASGRLTDAEGALALRDFEAEMGDRKVFWAALAGDVGDLPGFTHVELSLEFEESDLREMGLFLGEELPSMPIRGSAIIGDQDGDGEIDVENLQASGGRDGDLDFEVSGGLRDVFEAGKIDLSIGVGARDLARLGEFLSVDLPPIGPVTATGRLQRMGDTIGIADLDGLVGKEPKARADVTGRIADLRELSGLRLEGDIRAPDLSFLTELFGFDPPDIGPAEGSFLLSDQDGTFGLERFRLRGGPPELRFEVSGGIDDLGQIDEIDVQAGVRARDLATIGALMDRKLLAVGPVEFQGRVIGSDERAVARDVVVRLQDTRLGGSFEASFAPNARPSLKADIESPLVTLRDIGIAPEAESPRRRRRREGSGGRFRLEWLRDFDAELHVHAHRVIGRYGLEWKDFVVALTLDRGVLDLSDLGFRYEGGGSFTGRVKIDAGEQPPEMQLFVEGDEIYLERAVAQFTDDPILTGNARITTDLRSRGRSWRELLSSLQGDLAFLVERGTAASEYSRVFARDLVRAMTSEEWRDDDQNMRCLLARFEIDDGLATPDVLVLDTDFITLVGSGTVDLPRGELDLRITPKLWRPGFLSVAATVDLQGPINDPERRVVRRSIPGSAVGNFLSAGRRLFVGSRWRNIPRDLPEICNEALRRAEQVAG